ncbi:MAG: rhomboid family intramembrane serine protease [Flavobacteriales bacterium]
MDFAGHLALSNHGTQVLNRPYSLLTYALVHVDLWHLVSNVIVLYFFGQQLKQTDDKAPLWMLFILGCAIGAFTFILLTPSTALRNLAGASAGVICIAAYTVARHPRKQVSLFGLLSIEMIWIFLLILLIDFLAIQKGENLSGHLAHLGGAICGYLYAFIHRFSSSPMNVIAWIRQLFGLTSNQKNAHRRPKTDDEFNSERRAKEMRTDAILDKINRSGYDSLTSEEKEFLSQQSHR